MLFDPISIQLRSQRAPSLERKDVTLPSAFDETGGESQHLFLRPPYLHGADGE
jgi:hypothetical protein